MDVLECIKTRRSIRKFKDKPVEMEKLGVIIDAGRHAPSAGNLQDWKFILVTEQPLRRKIADACLQQFWIESAPVIIVICAEHRKEERFYGDRGEKIYSIENCSAAAENMFLAAHSQGLGCCWIAAFTDHMLRRALGIPEDVRPTVVLPIGYPDEKPGAVSRLRLEDVTYIENWGTRIRDVNAFLGYYSHKVEGAVKSAQTALSKLAKHIKK